MPDGMCFKMTQFDVLLTACPPRKLLEFTKISPINKETLQPNRRSNLRRNDPDGH